MRRIATALLALSLVGCSGDDEPVDAPPVVPSPTTSSAAAPSASPVLDTVTATLGRVELELEVADSPQERATGLMRRQVVPPGTGMVFLFDAPQRTRFYMYDVPIPLKAVFLRDGVVVEAIVMPPCPEPVPGDCPLYGPDELVDTVVETDPATLPDVQPGDRFVVEQ